MQHGHCYSVDNYSVREMIEESNYLHYINVNLTRPTQNKYKTVNTCKMEKNNIYRSINTFAAKTARPF